MYLRLSVKKEGIIMQANPHGREYLRATELPRFVHRVWNLSTVKGYENYWNYEKERNKK